MKTLKNLRQFKKKHKIAFWGIFFAIVLTVLFVTLVLSCYKYFDGRVFPNTSFSHFTLGGKDRFEVELLVNRSIDVYSKEKIRVLHNGEVKEFSLSDLGVALSAGETVDRIMKKSDNKTLLTRFDEVFRHKSVSPVYYISSKKLEDQLAGTFADVELPPIEATVVFAAGDFVATESVAGRSIDKDKLILDLKANLDLLNSKDIELVVSSVDPSVTREQAESVLGDFKALLGDQINVYYGYDKWGLTGASLFKLVSVASVDSVDKKYLKVTNLDDGVGIGLDFSEVDLFLDSISLVLDKQARDATLRFEDGKVKEFTSAQDGQILNREEAKRLLFEEIAKLNSDTNIVSLKLPVAVTKAKIANDEVNKLGIKELIGSGISYFAGSIPNRAFNVGLGASMINGTLVKPGEVFSFVNLVGDVSAAQGFKQAYVIKSGRTVLDDGGGICQVSTTVFRAALNSGLPIVKRSAHAYRVSYYEQKGFKAGLDATIFSPSVDLQFKNDTNKHILVQTTIDKASSRLQVDVYGTSDGRRVELGEPVVTNFVSAPEPKYEDDPTLPLGTIKQVDFAVAGATSVFTRKVYRDDELIIDESFKSVFRPWQAVYLVGKAG